MATLVEFFCSSEDAEENEEFLLSRQRDSTKKSAHGSTVGRGRKPTKVRGGRTNRIGREVRARNARSIETATLSESADQHSEESTASKDKQLKDTCTSSKLKVSQMRRSCRTKTPSKYFVPEVQDTRQKRLGTARRAARKPGQPDVNQDGTPFCCDKCGSNYIVKPGRCLTSKGHAAAPKRKRVFGIRYKTDPETKKRLTLCNACGIRFDRQEKNQDRYKVPKATDQDKLKYLEEAKRFASSLVEGLKDPDADRLACLHISSKPCGCMQRYIIAEGNMEKSRDRASILLKMIKDAKKLKEKKSYSIEELINKGKKFRKVGLGNGQKRSKEFEEFVLTNRQYLRNQLKFCERACQRILSYSNNFLHKKLKTEPERRERIERTKGKMALGLLKDITELSDIKCCEAECSLMAQSHAVLLKTWRERANSGQAEARKVLAEMLTPSGKVSNCANFITLVTGCSLSTIQSVATQMRETGGDREPPAHGLKRYWKNHPRRQRSLSELEQDVLGTRESQPVAQKASTDRTTSTERGGGGDNNSAATDIETPALTATQLREQQNQLKRLQQHLDEQQRRISQQQSVIEQQLQQHKLAMQQKRLQQKQRQQQQQLQQEQQQQQLSETQQQEIIQAQQQATSEEVGSQSTARQQAETQQASTQQQQQQVAQLVAQQQLLLHQLGAQQIAQQLVAQQQQVASTGTAVTVAQPSVAMEGMMDSRLLQQNTQQLLQEIQNQINVQQNNMHQLLLEMQSEMTAQQLQQLGIPSSSGVSSGTTVQTVTAAAATASQPPPSYNAAVTLLNALNSGQMLNNNSVLNTSTQLLPQQQQQQQSQQQGPAARQGAVQPAQVIIQAIPAIQQNFLLGGTGLHGQLLSAGDSRQAPQQQQQQILVSLPPSLTTECMTSSALTATSLSQDSLNPEMVEIVELQQIPLGSGDPSQSQGNGIQQVNLPGELDAAAIARLSRVLNSQEIRPTVGSALHQLHGRASRTATSSASDLAALARDSSVQSVLQGDSNDGQASSSSLANEASQLNIESLLPELQLQAPVGQGMPVFRQNNPSKSKH